MEIIHLILATECRYLTEGKEGKGKERKGKERKGKERKGKERKGKERKGKERKGPRIQDKFYFKIICSVSDMSDVGL